MKTFKNEHFWYSVIVFTKNCGASRNPFQICEYPGIFSKPGEYILKLQYWVSEERNCIATSKTEYQHLNFTTDSSVNAIATVTKKRLLNCNKEKLLNVTKDLGDYVVLTS